MSDAAPALHAGDPQPPKSDRPTTSDRPVLSGPNCAWRFFAYSLASAAFACLLVYAVGTGAVTTILLGAEQQVWDDSYLDHLRAVRPIYACYQSEKVDDQEKPLSRDKRARLYRTLIIAAPTEQDNSADKPGTQPQSTIAAMPQTNPATPEPFDLEMTVLQSWQRQIVDVSYSLASRRTETIALAQQSLRARNQMQTWLILIGALTTVLVGAKAIISASTCLSTFVGIAAVVTSAIGTALASFSGLYAPGDAWNGNRQTMSELRRAHAELVLVASGIENVCSKPPDAVLQQLADLSRRSIEIIAPRSENNSRPVQPSQRQ